MLGTALVGILVNVAASGLIARADRTSLNVEGAFPHILNDLFAFIATAIAGLLVILTGWVRADAVAALIVAGLMAKAGWGLIRDFWRIFLEAAPHGTDVAAIDTDLHAVDGVLEVHDHDTMKNGPARSQATVWACWAGHSQRRSLNAVYRTTDTMSIKPSANG